jgi:hypothetical protein
MSLKAPPRVSGTKREEKETKLKEFLQHTVARLGATQQRRETRPTCLLVARSADSPVAKAVFALSPEIGAGNFILRAIFGTLGTAETAIIAQACRESDLELQIRWARDIRLMDAHEQLVLPPDARWMGDCMRRDPAKRDAYEHYAIACRETAKLASICFERLWVASEPVIERKQPVLLQSDTGPRAEVSASALGMAQASGQPAEDQVRRGTDRAMGSLRCRGARR